MAKYRKKPIVIEAEHIYSYMDLPRVCKWITDSGGKATYGQEDHGPARMLISTLEGVMEANVGDWIIRGVAGEFYPCRGDVFRQTYEVPPGEMSHIPVESSNLMSVAYDPAEALLQIRFKGREGVPGYLYEYEEVDIALFAAFMAADSKGKYFAEHIKSKPTRKIS